ncbi:hypothetical protein NQ318_005262 [Aromia moschata]|uniref:Uncharacterized protein n=1 Tax=Aromia moschata TaxID=1265417 RepID=A0AAV8Y266_9CUCU|nr:hypothetical protein NQ318_005262 [Aromia moschata]
MILSLVAGPLLLLLQRSCLAAPDDFYPETAADAYALYPEDLSGDGAAGGGDVEVRRRSSNFLRFGRAKGRYDGGDDGAYDDDYEEYARPTRRTEKNDHFIRFGRGKQDQFLRFGRDPRRAARSKSMYIRFGRSIHNEETSAKRSKREAIAEDKRSDAFLRFGRNSNFMRFGRDPSEIDTHGQPDLLKLKQLSEPTLIHLLTQIIARRQADKQCASAA